ncbi:histamine H2 receptor [Nematostella vectensis]|uniref:histamine H2 receptor n=1 Tax=Nematostella vectensis TaxID=45351 RepID=UPI00207724AB|nr:histamine H2 receptor [Nematostella vectensis]
MNDLSLSNQSEFVSDCPGFLVERWPYGLHERSMFIATSVLNIPFGLMAIAGNALILCAIFRNISLHQPSYMLLCSLVLSDFCVGFLVQPMYGLWKVFEIRRNFQVYCHLGTIFSALSIALSGVSFLNILLVTLDRFLALFLHLRYNSMVTMHRTRLAIFVIWVVGATNSAIQFIDRKFYFMSSCAIIFLSIPITLVCYYQIFRVIKRLKKQVSVAPQKNTMENNNNNSNNNNNTMAHYKKSVVSVFYIYGLFFLCYLPYTCTMVYMLVYTRGVRTDMTYHVSGTIVLLNSSLNPIIYCWKIRELRQAVKRIIPVFN